MGAVEMFGFVGRRALVVGGSSGIGEATVDALLELGADVVVMDIVPCERDGVSFIGVDLADKDSIERAVAVCDGPFHALASCAGVPDGDRLPTINFIGQRYLIERALDAGLLPRGASVVMVASAAGRDWRDHVELLLPYVTAPSFEDGQAWIDAHREYANYRGNKLAVCVYVARSAFEFGTRGVRINAVSPGLTDTPLAHTNSSFWTYASTYRDELGLSAATPAEQAMIIAFLCSPAASRISGETVLSENGHSVSMLTGSREVERLA